MKKTVCLVIILILIFSVCSYGQDLNTNMYVFSQSNSNEYYSFDSTNPDDPYFSSQWGLSNINASSAWDITKGKDSLLVGVVDTGIDASHLDLQSNINQSLSYSLVDNNSLYDGVGHGTHVAGIIGAQGNNNLGVVGTCWDVSLVSIKISQTGSSITNNNIISAIDYAEDNNIHILNMSFGGNSYDYSVQSRIESFDGIIICAAGNYSSNNDTNLFYPASYTNSNIISVASSNSINLKAIHSNYGATSVDLFAPGVGIKSTYPTALESLGYSNSTGTSMATPFVTGVAALIKSLNPSFSNSFIKQAILDNVTDVFLLNGYCASGGVLNAGAAVDYSRHNCNYFLSNSDHIDGKPGRVRVSGWAFDPNDSSDSMRIHVYIGGSASSGTGEHYDIGLTDVTRNDVNTHYGITGDHGYNFDVHTDLRGTQEVNVYVVNNEWGTSKKIGSATVNIPTGNPQGHIDHVYKAASNKVYVSGWAFDYDAPFSAIAIHVYIGGSAGTTGAERHALSTNTLRTDINSLYDLSGNHGFAHNITTSKTGTQEVYIYAINAGAGPNICLGHQSVTI